MELITINNHKPPIKVEHALTQVVENIEVVPTSSPLIEANTITGSLDDINSHHTIPVWIKDNETVISHGQFIETMTHVAKEVYAGEAILNPDIRLSHPIKGRIPSARNKLAIELLESEKTLYYERMAFIIEIPSIYTNIGESRLTLTIGGVKAYNLDNLYNRSGADQHFKVFVGFKNKVCTNLSVSTDGFLSNLKVKNIAMLQNAVSAILQNFNSVQMAEQLQAFHQYELTEQQFATLIGRCRMYKYLPDNDKAQVPELLFGESQLNSVCNDYYKDKYFCRADNGNINLWHLYNLFTGANKSTYIDSFLDRSLNAYELTRELLLALQNQSDCWYLS